MELIRKYFTDLDAKQIEQFRLLFELIPRINKKVNLISRMDVDHLEERHILHSLSIAKRFSFEEGTMVIDAGTGGGFPGIPLAVIFPRASFLLVDSIAKKIRVVREIAAHLELAHVEAIESRLEQLRCKADFVVSRAVTSFPNLYSWCWDLLRSGDRKEVPGGLISLKGGELESELEQFRNRVEIYEISQWFREPFFSTKKIVFLKK